MEERNLRTSKDLILAQGEYALVQDGSNGCVQVVVGPSKQSLGETDQLMTYDKATGRFEQANMQEAIVACPTAREGQYVVLHNPAKEKGGIPEHPNKGKQDAVELDMGRTVNIAGPATFPLYPGQSAEVIDGHVLRTNQYLMVRVVNSEEATKNWEQQVLKPQTVATEIKATGSTTEDEVGSKQVSPAPGENDRDSTDQESGSGDDTGGNDQETTPTNTPPTPPIKDEVVEEEPEGIPELITGQLMIIKGTEASFYIPPTGIEVVPEDGRGNYVREAVTLEQLEYCILLDESGDKEYVQGPRVVFPTPTQRFFAGKSKSRKFRAIELEEHWGVYVKVIKDYSDGGTDYEEGQELFITGKKQRIYYPRPEHSIITYGDQQIHYAVAIPDGEARYVLNRETGAVKMVEGPKMFLPDPRNQVVVRRVLNPNLVGLLYPGNEAALRYNLNLMSATDGNVYSEVESLGGSVDGSSMISRGRISAKRSTRFDEQPEDGMAAEEFARKTQHTPPRTIQLDTKFDGAVAICVWTGYAVKLVDRTGKSRIITGPQTVLLEYGEEPEVFELSTGTPKTDDHLHKDVFLRVLNNKISDEIEAETSDFVRVRIPISYRVNFEGEEGKWFDVENFVKFLTDHLRSLVANVVKQHGIEKLHAGYIDILRDAILGVSGDGAEGAKNGDRPGRLFDENGMRIYDVEFSQIEIGDSDIAQMLEESQHETVEQTLKLASARRGLENTKALEQISRDIANEEDKTALNNHNLSEAAAGRALQTLLTKVTNAAKEADARFVSEEAARKAKRDADQAHTTAVRQFDETEKKAGCEAEVAVATARREAEVAAQAGLNQVAEAELARTKAEDDQKLAVAKAELEGEVKAIVDKAAAITPDLIAALQEFSDKDVMARTAEAMAPMAIFGGKSVAEVLAGIFAGTPLAQITDILGKTTERREARRPSGDSSQD
ncbi:hypothetical protein HN859_04075 [Candidatus Parcubacteria bacterium]|jgi:major vault protein|nr:hypothetical protein [Candidatus Parcubacteria bacterium]